MRHTPLVVGAFTARDIKVVATSFNAAWLIARDQGSPFLVISERSLRAGLAFSILVATRQGIRDPHLLVARALRELARGLAG